MWENKGGGIEMEGPKTELAAPASTQNPTPSGDKVINNSVLPLVG